jgi:hypothetical protein
MSTEINNTSEDIQPETEPMDTNQTAPQVIEASTEPELKKPKVEKKKPEIRREEDLTEKTVETERPEEPSKPEPTPVNPETEKADVTDAIFELQGSSIPLFAEYRVSKKTIVAKLERQVELLREVDPK